MKVPLVIVSNVYEDDNRGGAAITASAIECLQEAYPGCAVAAVPVRPGDPHVALRHTLARFPDVEVLPPPFPVSTRPLGGAWVVIRSMWVLANPSSVRRNPTLVRLSQADIVMGKGGYIFFQRRRWRDLLSLWLTAFPVTYAARVGIPAVVHAGTIGPFPTRLSRLVNGFVLRRATLVLPRDAASFATCIALGVAPDRVVEVPDSVFSLPPPSPSVVEAVARRLGLEGVRYAAFTIQVGPGSEEQERRFVDNLEALARSLLDDEPIERIVLSLQVGGPTSDLTASEAFVKRMDDPRVTLMLEDLSVEDMVAFYASAACTIGTRLHSTIFSLVAGTPAFAVSLSGDKVDGVFRSVGLEDWVLPYPDFSVDEAAVLVNQVLRDEGAGRERVASAVEPAKKAASGISALIRERIGISVTSEV